mmetsp:Transcript_142285/g.442388  ORF Transcript_142285/g.442388 Transcript_142285/m.442388 type:complete len:301 (+) Transcript_142285:104-1006(+)
MPSSAALCVLLRVGTALALRAQVGPPSENFHLSTATKWAMASEVGMKRVVNMTDASLNDWWRQEGSFKQAPDTSANRTYSIVAPQFHQCAARFAEDTARSCGGQACDVVFVGDSITELMNGTVCYSNDHTPMRLSFFIPSPWRAHIIAGGGDQTQHTLGHLSRCLPRLRTPKLFVLLIGTNNIGPSGRYSTVMTALGVKAVARALRVAHPEAKILLHAILPRYDFDALEIIREANRQLQGWQEPGVQFVDCGEAFLTKNRTALRQMLPDLLHPSFLGYNEWFKCLRPTIARDLGLPDAMP